MADTRDAYEILQLHPSALPEVVEAAYRALALVHHPDRNGNRDGSAMAELNWAYSVLRDPEQRMAYDRTRRPPPAAASRPSGPSLAERVGHTRAAQPDRAPGGTGRVVLDFGRYAGMTLSELARVDPVYLEWLRRHSSGARYRHHIDAVLAALATRRAAAAAARQSIQD